MAIGTVCLPWREAVHGGNRVTVAEKVQNSIE
jgi:hypothetical protein